MKKLIALLLCLSLLAVGALDYLPLCLPGRFWHFAVRVRENVAVLLELRILL